MNHTAYFGDADYAFALTDDMILELERKTDVGIGALYLRIVNAQFHIADILEIIRLGLIGGGTTPVAAQRLIDAYAKNRPFDETFPLALDILDSRWTGKAEPLDDLRQAALLDEMSAINETLEGAGL